MKTANSEKISTVSKLLILISSVLLFISIFVPLWRIDLDAPQYPEGLRLLIYTYKIGGDAEIINGLNHYIGMKTLHAEDFLEFTVLPYIIGAFALFALITAFVSRKKMLYALLISFALFGILSMVDFWRWEYNYGHNLDPNAAIVVPGMAYQPPLIGFKQLLNFGAFSIPSYGGWMFVICGILLLTAVIIETGTLQKINKNKAGAAVVLLICIITNTACTNKGAQPIKLNVDNCDYCKMTISDGKMAAEVITKKGRVYKFDDIICMHGYVTENKNTEYANQYIADYLSPANFINVETAFYVRNNEIKSPMGGNTAAFSDKEKANEFAKKYNTDVLNWTNLNL